MDHHFYQVEDFIADEGFQSSVFKTEEKNIAYWNRWLLANPDKKDLVEQASHILLSLQLKESPLAPNQLEDAANNLLNAFQEEKEKKSKKILNIRGRIIWYAAAAVFTGVLAFSFYFLLNNFPKPHLSTDYGQIKQEKLPDGSEVILNANSKLIYPKQWKKGKDREVWINGEAFFNVKKTALQNKFIVHTDAFDIEVTGTSFVVINRKGKSSIILKEGSVKIHRPGEADILMKPGDFVEFSDSKIQKKKIEKEDYMVWTESKLVFDNTTLKQLAIIIKDHYGIEVKLQGNEMEQKTINGIMPNDNLETLLQSLEATQEFTIERTKSGITIITKANN
jgi:transmembrane sensor